MSNTIPTTKVTKDVLLRKMSVQLQEVLHKFAKDNGATENFAVKVTPDEKVEFSWEIDKKTFLAEDEDAPAPEPQYDSLHRVYRVATGELQVGDLVMYQPFGTCAWNGPSTLRAVHECDKNYGVVRGAGLVRVRHLTDEERAKIKRI